MGKAGYLASLSQSEGWAQLKQLVIGNSSSLF